MRIKKITKNSKEKPKSGQDASPNMNPIMKHMVEFVTISDNDAQQRIDNFLVKKLKGVPKSHLYRIIRKGEVRVNKGRISVSYKLAAGDVVRIPPVRHTQKSNQESSFITEGLSKLNHFKELQDRVLYEDAHLIVINKPSGMAVHGGSGVQLGLIEALRLQRASSSNTRPVYLELVHRLDRETSGCLLIAKKRSMLKNLHAMLRDGRIEKTYTTFVEGDWKGPNRVEAPLQKNHLQSNERMVFVDPNGKPAVTDFRVMARLEIEQPNKASNSTDKPVYKGTLLQARPLTGRTHQIRVHTQFMGHSVAADEKYGKKEFNTIVKQQGLPRLFLHASQLTFKMPGSEQLMRFTAELDDDLKCFLKNINITGDDLCKIPTIQ